MTGMVQPTLEQLKRFIGSSGYRQKSGELFGFDLAGRFFCIACKEYDLAKPEKEQAFYEVGEDEYLMVLRTAVKVAEEENETTHSSSRPGR